MKKDRYAVYSLNVELTFEWSEKIKNPNALKKHFKESIEQNIGGELLLFAHNGDRVSITLSYPPKWSVSSMVNLLKSRSSRFLSGGQWLRDYKAVSLNQLSQKEKKNG